MREPGLNNKCEKRKRKQDVGRKYVFTVTCDGQWRGTYARHR